MKIFPMANQYFDSYRKGVCGEEQAETLLCSSGMSCIERRYRSPYGEIDLIMLDGETLVFVEVKARQNDSIYSAHSAVTPAKQRRIIQTALCYLNEHPEHVFRPMRFDIVGLSDDCAQHFPDAFQGAGW